MAEVRVLSVQSSVVHGYVGNRAAGVPLVLHGVEVDVVNTVQLSAHTGYPHHGGSVLQSQDLRLLVNDLRANGVLPTYTHLLAGYVGSTDFLRQLAKEMAAMRADNPNVAFFVDPVLGDDGNFYVPKENAEVYAKEIIPLATCITPNQFELEQLVGMSVSTEEEMWTAIAALHSMGPRVVVVTSSQLPGLSAITGFASQASANGETRRHGFSVERLPFRFVGTGDVFAALLLVWLGVRGATLREALAKTLGSLQAVLQATVRHAQGRTGPKDLELRLVQNPQLLLQPQPFPIADLDVFHEANHSN